MEALREFNVGDVESVMTSAPITVDPDDLVLFGELAMTFAESRHVPVARRGRLMGILSLRDLLAGQSGTSSRPLFVREVMTPMPVSIGPQDSIREAAMQLEKHRVSSLPVVCNGELIGIVTTSDLVEYSLAPLRLEAEELGRPPVVARLMTPCPIETISLHEHVDLARLLMRAGKHRHLPVMDHERLVGILSDRDLMKAVGRFDTGRTSAARLMKSASIEVRTLMTPSPFTVTPESAALDAGRLLLRKKIGALPVLRSGRLTGMLTEMDFLTYLVTL